MDKRAPERQNPLAAEAKFQGLLESAPDGIVVVDTKGNIVIVNSQTEKMFGYPRNELLGKKVEVLVPQKYKHSHVGQRDQYISKPRTRPMGAGQALTGQKKDGTEFPVEISLSPLETEQGTLIMSIIRDITDRREAEEKLKASNEELIRSNKELEAFAYVASHDLQEPLRMVTSYVQLLQHSYKTNTLKEEADEYIEYAVQGVNRMRHLIDDLLNYSRIRSKALECHPRSLDPILKIALQNLQASISESHAEITNDPLPILNVDESQMIQLFQNLIGNAIKFRRESPPKIHIFTKRYKNICTICVRDNGIGIEPKYHDKIFKIFQRLHTREKYPGTGIGLAICSLVVERHGGKIWVESEPGKGSTFCFSLRYDSQDEQPVRSNTQ
jgi:PAS domain S-box-containing protein